MGKRQTSFTPVQINLIQSEGRAWDGLPNASSFDEAATASLINFHQRYVLQTDCSFFFFFSSLSWLWLMARAPPLCHKIGEMLQLLFKSILNKVQTHFLTNLES